MSDKVQVHKIEWLLDSSEVEDAASEVGAVIETKEVSYPYPEGWAEGYSSHTQTSDGMELVRSSHRFFRNVCPPEINVGKFSVKLAEPVFAVTIVHRGSLAISDPSLLPKKTLRMPGLDLFAHIEQYSLEQSFNTKTDLELSALMIPMSQLNILMGEELASSMLNTIGIEKFNSFNPSLKVPPSISNILDDCLDNRLTDKLKALRLHSGVLEYLCSLSLYLDSKVVTLHNKPSRSRAKAVHDHLITIDGKTPTLAGLSKRFGASPNQLNKEFMDEYHESIFSFLTNHRLEQAKYALELGHQPIKVISHTIGYSHVNHFITAFKRKFGLPPGAFRSGLSIDKTDQEIDAWVVRGKWTLVPQQTDQ
ncbi:AraC-like DNA-binding protein [Jezberella montanilacus]|uniref:AraC-like DNA-binding protein n=1 Tax=Jezberella montanilacus TaxID=323426 RepID=A0A2T0XG92_9BURK|nr:helix-turn-helix transcriptional regulator [Jezberella montanilacus]PRY97910.1 AraC-like DNA-binding protein [Jezberella montanilacus]|eukprot:gene3204-3247_t